MHRVDQPAYVDGARRILDKLFIIAIVLFSESQVGFVEIRNKTRVGSKVDGGRKGIVKVGPKRNPPVDHKLSQGMKNKPGIVQLVVYVDVSMRATEFISKTRPVE